LNGRGALLALALLSCTPTPPPVVAKAWSTSTFFRAPNAPFIGAGYPNTLLISTDGGIPWRTELYGETGAVSDGTWSLAVQPAYQAGQVAAYVVTEIWDTHPDLWIQPVYHLRSNGVLKGGVFGVGVESTFYSPYWRVYDADLGTHSVEDVTTVADVVNDGLALTKQAIWVCPIVPALGGVNGVTANLNEPGGVVPVRPFTFEPVTIPDYGAAQADGAPVWYLNFGERQVGQIYEEGADGTVEAADFYMFARSEADGGRTPLHLPAVLADETALHAYVRRVDVVMQDEKVFVPFGMDALRSEVNVELRSDAGAPEPAFGIDSQLAAQYMLRVATDDSCFHDAGSFPQDCHWLDSEGAIDELPPSRVLDSTVTLTATPVLLGGQKL
jgi:hypothetical protein